MNVDLPDTMVLCVAGCANETGPGVELMVKADWWMAQPKEVRRTMFLAVLESLRQVGEKVIGGEYIDGLMGSRPN